jgi:hypothetical protein
MTPPGAKECIKNELNWVENHLDLTKTAQAIQTHQSKRSPGEDFTETIKKQQARYVMAIQFTPPLEPPSKTKPKTQSQQLEEIMKSSPLARLAQLKEENRQWRIMDQLDTIEQHLTLQKTPHSLPTPPETPPPKVSERFQTLGQILEVNRTTAATQWAIDAHKSAIPETTELPPHYQQHWCVFSEKLAQRFPPTRKDNHAIKLQPGTLDTIPSRAYK